MFDLTTIGEGQIRLTVPQGERLSNTRQLRMTAACSEANVSGLLSQLGRRTSWCSVMPESDLAERCLSEFRAVGGDIVKGIDYGLRVSKYALTHHGDLTLITPSELAIPIGLLLGAQAQLWLGEPIGWRGLIALGALPIFLLLWLRMVPESPRFLQSRGRDDEARAAYAWALEMPVDEVGDLPDVEETRKSSLGVIFSRYPKELIIITVGSFSFILGSLTVQSWGQTLLKDGFGFSAAMVGGLFTIVSLADVAGRLGSAWLAERIGRRMVMLLFGLLGAVGCVIAATTDNAWVFFIGIVVTMTFGDGAFGILNAFGAEQFPNEARSTGLGLGYGIGATAKIIGPFLMGWLVGGDAIKQNVTRDAVPPAFLLFAALLVVGGITYLLPRRRATSRWRRSDASTGGGVSTGIGAPPPLASRRNRPEVEESGTP